MKKKSNIFLFLLIPLMMSCASNVKTKKYSDTNLKNFKTFAYFAETNAFDLSEFNSNADNPVEESLITLINAKMIENGYTADTKNPDLLILLETSNQIRSNLNNDRTDRQGQISQGPNYASTTSSVGFKRYNDVDNDIESSNRPFKKGDLAIQVFNAKSKELLWVGIAEDFKAHISDQTLMARMIAQVFNKFPN
jgi:hypothetical protein